MRLQLTTILLIFSLSSQTSATEIFLSGYDNDTGSGRFDSVSADGSVVAGSYTHPAKWSPESGWMNLKDADRSLLFINGFVSDDGQITGVHGCIRSETPPFGCDAPTSPILVSSEHGFELLEMPSGFVAGAVLGMSADGTTLGVGMSDGVETVHFRWTREDGFKSVARGDPFSSMSVSADGSTLIGAVSDPVIQAYRWNETDGFQRLGVLEGKTVSRASGVSRDGSVVVGASWLGDFSTREEHRAFRWTAEEGMVGLGALLPQRQSSASAVSRDGSIVIGSVWSLNSPEDGFIWDAVHGMRDFEEVLEQEHGFTLPRELSSRIDLIDLSANNRVIIGKTSRPDGYPLDYWSIYLNRPLVVTSGVAGDFNSNSELDIEDLDIQALELQSDRDLDLFDVNGDRIVDLVDRQFWVHDLARTYFGDANLDGEFDAADLVTVLQAGKFGTGEPASWSEGDWNADRIFDANDIVLALQDDGYNRGSLLAVNSVPEPSSVLLLVIGSAIGFLRFRTTPIS